MLVTELAMRQRSATVQPVLAHLELAASLLDRLPKPRAGHDGADGVQRFREEWHVLAASLLLAWTDPRPALSFADRGLHVASESARLHTLSGMALEMSAHIVDNNLHDRNAIATLPRNPARGSLVLAEPRFRKALALDPDEDEARVHLGRVLFLRQQNKEAREALAYVIGRERAAPRLRYLAHLFAGAIDELEHEWRSAAQHYEHAMQIAPDRQTPYVALSFVEQAMGHDARARELVETWSRRTMSEQDDPWWDYQNGGVDDDAFAWLRAQVILK
jgi:tetratricopeptide (TPR) repeat protein